MLDSSGIRVVGYLVVAGVAVCSYRSERRALADQRPSDSTTTDRWPTYWLLTAVVLVAMALGRAEAVGDVVAELGRERAREGGWYESRRELQAAAIDSIAVAWLLTVFVAIWRVPPRRRRYLPNVVAVSSLVAFAAARMISLHQIDAVLDRRDLGGVRIVTITELGLLALSVVTIALADRRPTWAPTPGDEPGAARHLTPDRR